MPDCRQGEVGRIVGPLFHKACVFGISQAVGIARFESTAESHDRMLLRRTSMGTELLVQVLQQTNGMYCSCWDECPKDPAVLKILRVVNLLRVLNLLSHCDSLSPRTLCGHHFPVNYRHFSSQRRVCGIVNFGGRSQNTTA